MGRKVSHGLVQAKGEGEESRSLLGNLRKTTTQILGGRSKKHGELRGVEAWGSCRGESEEEGKTSLKIRRRYGSSHISAWGGKREKA